MKQIKKVSLQKLESIQGGMALFYTPQSSHETMLVQIPPKLLMIYLSIIFKLINY